MTYFVGVGLGIVDPLKMKWCLRNKSQAVVSSNLSHYGVLVQLEVELLSSRM